MQATSRDEGGHHRLRAGKDEFVAKVHVALPLSQRPASLLVFSARPLATVGQYGGRVRSRVEVAGGEFVVQKRQLSGKRELAEEFAPSRLILNPIHSVVTTTTWNPFPGEDFCGLELGLRVLLPYPDDRSPLRRLRFH